MGGSSQTLIFIDFTGVGLNAWHTIHDALFEFELTQK